MFEVVGWRREATGVASLAARLSGCLNHCVGGVGALTFGQGKYRVEIDGAKILAHPTSEFR